MRNTLQALFLVLALCCPASAGDMLNPPVAPPPPPATAAQAPTTDAEIDTTQTTGAEIPDNPTTVIIEVVLNLLALL